MNETKKYEVKYFPWDYNGYKPETTVELTRNNDGFYVHFTSYETELRAVETEHNTDVYLDSTVEAFLNFMPETDDRYINFEVNSNGAMHCGVGSGRYGRVFVEPCDIDTLSIKTEIFADRWEAEFFVTVDFIKKIYPDYVHGGKVTGNLYKTGEGAKYPHWGCVWETKSEKPDFHRPERFNDIF